MKRCDVSHNVIFLFINLFPTLYFSRSSRSQMFFKIDFLKNVANLIGKHLCWSLFYKFVGLKAYNFIKKKFQHRCFPVKFTTYLRTRFFTEHLLWQLPICCARVGHISHLFICFFGEYSLTVYVDRCAT